MPSNVTGLNYDGICIGSGVLGFGNSYHLACDQGAPYEEGK